MVRYGTKIFGNHRPNCSTFFFGDPHYLCLDFLQVINHNFQGFCQKWQILTSFLKYIIILTKQTPLNPFSTPFNHIKLIKNRKKSPTFLIYTIERKSCVEINGGKWSKNGVDCFVRITWAFSTQVYRIVAPFSVHLFCKLWIFTVSEFLGAQCIKDVWKNDKLFAGTCSILIQNIFNNRSSGAGR